METERERGGGRWRERWRDGERAAVTVVLVEFGMEADVDPCGYPERQRRAQRGGSPPGGAPAARAGLFPAGFAKLRPRRCSRTGPGPPAEPSSPERRLLQKQKVRSWLVVCGQRHLQGPTEGARVFSAQPAAAKPQRSDPAQQPQVGGQRWQASTNQVVPRDVQLLQLRQELQQRPCWRGDGSDVAHV